ncbi:2'-5' RNA ligase family protein [Bradyrhizobium icense]|uniref:2'-5' RNA ligase family protein n=1 Tax=Bradyrhizobium icense TaxID=1274631 RepID=UPI0018D463D6|nr:2'-5' RNA ligase family protein [Bradyrhizobium icense]
MLKRAHKFDGKLIAPDRLHVSLFSLSGLPDRQLCAARDAATELRTAPFEVSFDRTASFRGRGNRPFVLIGEKGLRRLQSFRQMLGVAMARRGLRRIANTNFTPHVTLLYDARGVDEYPVEPVVWTVTEFVLVHSQRGHRHLARWCLRA